MIVWIQKLEVFSTKITFCPKSHLAVLDPEPKKVERLDIFPTKYVIIPKKFKFG